MKVPYPFAVAALALAAFVPARADVPVIPKPAKESASGDYAAAIAGTRVFTASVNCRIEAPKELAGEEKHLRTALARMTKKAPKSARGAIALSLDKKLPPEGYKRKIETGRISVEGGSAAGVFYGVQTLNQMLFASRLAGKPGVLPCVAIEDAPLCSWRGVHVDSARHFQPKEWIMKFA